jgi:hypothetical protein
MNDRIRELEDQAGYIQVDDRFSGGYITFNTEKFAELIVREACLALWTEECHVSDLAFDEVKRNATRIKEHFGIDPREITTDMLDRSIKWMEKQLAENNNETDKL